VGQTVNQAHYLKLWQFPYEENGQKCEWQECEIFVRTMYHSHSTVEPRVLGRVFIRLILSILLLLTKTKIILKGRFQTVEDIITNKSAELRVIQQTSFKQCLRKFERWWKQCIAVQGNYFEKDKHNLSVSLEMKLLLTNSRNLLKKIQLFIHLQQKEISSSLYLNTTLWIPVLKWSWNSMH
jgi:hypothetical protein